MHLLLVCLACWLAVVAANVEKAIFLAPQHVQAASAPPRLQRLSPAAPTLRRRLHAAFAHSPPSPAEPREAWILLEGLTPGQRYEARVCWSATEPTEFDLAVHEPAAVAQDAALRASLHAYLDSHAVKPAADPPAAGSSLLLRVSAAADYFADDARLMSDGQLVTLDIILDPFLLNMFPASLVPTAAYIAALAFAAWFVSSAVATGLHRLATFPGVPKKTN